MTERISHLTKLVLAGEMYPQKQAVEYSREDLFLTHHARSGKRIYEYVTAQTPVLTEYSAMTGLFVFDGSVEGDAMSVAGLRHIQQLLKTFYKKPLDNLSTFEWQHATADYNKIIRKGVAGLIDEIERSKLAHEGDENAIDFLNALRRSAEAMIDWAHKCSDEAKKFSLTVENPEYRANLEKLSEALLRVPEHPAESFYEAVLSIYILFSYDPDSLGTLDRTLSDFYFNDLESGKLTRDEAKEILQELFLMLQAKTPRKSPNFTRGGESHFCVGGYLPNHEDAFSDLSMLILEAMTELPTYIPQISLRWTKKLPREIFRKVLDFERNDPHKRIAFVNDEEKITGFMRINKFSFEDACRYSSLGCNESAFPGGFVGGTTNTNGVRCMQNTFFGHEEELLKCNTFEEFFEIFKKELHRDLDLMLEHSNKFNAIRAKDTSYVTSLLFDGCIEKAISLSQGAIRLSSAGFAMLGLVNLIDSLAVVKQFVFDEQRIDMQTMIDALHANWEGYEDLHTEIAKHGKFFGNNDETSNFVARLYTTTVAEHLKDKRNLFGYHLSLGNLQGYTPHHQMFGSATKATPDGRRDGEMLKFGVGQNGGRDREGLAALLASVAKYDPNYIICGSTVTNLYLDEQLVRNDENFEKLILLLENYFLMGGRHFQLNYVSKEDLIHAKESPEDYLSLRVRVSGFADHFVNLKESIQDDIIARTTHAR